jgi:hypothetical protein
MLPRCQRLACLACLTLQQAGALEREVQAVDSEFKGVLQSDHPRLAQLMCHTVSCAACSWTCIALFISRSTLLQQEQWLQGGGTDLPGSLPPLQSACTRQLLNMQASAIGMCSMA